MSLDVYLEMESQVGERRQAIFVRECGETRELTREEWDARYPDREPSVVEIGGDKCVYDANITHNLNKMASEAGLYEPLWRPGEVGITKAEQLIEPLTIGLGKLKADPAKFMKLNPSNGWGSYEGLVRFVEAYLSACHDWPNANVRVSR